MLCTVKASRFSRLWRSILLLLPLTFFFEAVQQVQYFDLNLLKIYLIFVWSSSQFSSIGASFDNEMNEAAFKIKLSFYKKTTFLQSKVHSEPQLSKQPSSATNDNSSPTQTCVQILHIE